MTYINKQQILEKAKEYQCSPFGIPLIIAEIEKTDGVEVKHGSWIKVHELCGINILKCSVCNNYHPRLPTAYCCDCGAKMDGGKVE